MQTSPSPKASAPLGTKCGPRPSRNARAAILIAALASCGLTAIAGPAQAAGEDFDAYTQGRIIQFDRQGYAYGLEQYLPDRRVIWSFGGGECLHGEWFAQNDEICFVYEDSNTPVCWNYDIDQEGLTVSIDSTDAGGAPLVLNENRAATVTDMLCLGPKVGV